MTDNKKIITFLIIAAIIAGGYYFFFSDRNTENGQQTTEQEKVSKSDVIAKELGDRYQATTGWEENLNYTLQAQERLVTGKPTMFRGYIDDIFKQGDKNFIRFSSSFLSPIDYVLEFECSQQIVDKIFAQKPDSKDFLKFLTNTLLWQIYKKLQTSFCARGFCPV